MLLEDVISNFPIVTADAVAISYRPRDDAEWEFVWVNDAFCMMFHADQLDVLGRHPDTIHHPDYRSDFLEHVAEMKKAGRSYLTIGTRCACDDGDEFWASLSLFIIRDKEGEGRHCVFNIRDIDDLKDREQAAELALIENEQLLSRVEAAQTRLISAIETTGDPFAIFDGRGKLAIWNPAYAALISEDPNCLEKGMKFGKVLRMGAENGRFPDAKGQIDLWVSDTLDAWMDNRGVEHHLRTVDRTYRVVLTHAENGDRVLLMIDISELLEQQRELKIYAERLEHSNQEFSYQALHDELTGLGNRRYLNLKLEEWAAAREASGNEIAALHIDLDRFKQINDTMGHAAGDFVLEIVSERLHQILREKDVITRTGGDEFVALIACDIGSEVPKEVAERLVEEMAKPVTFEGRPCDFGASIGVAQTPLIQPDELLTSSDIALYKAKTAGRGCVGVFDSSDLEDLHAAKHLGDDIMRALEQGEFVPAFLPEVDPATGALVGFEALARWRHPERGLLLPSEFLDAADDLQILDQIDKAVFEATMNTCAQMFADAGWAPNLAFNLSHARLLEADLAESILHWNYPGEISLELVENVFLEDESIGFLRSLEDLRKAGVKLTVDDFGSGRASIVALRRLAPDRLKIDARLIEPIASSDTALQLVRSIFDLGRALKIDVIAEGVETQAQTRALCDIGFNRAQGYYFSQPMMQDELTDYIGQQKTSKTG